VKIGETSWKAYYAAAQAISCVRFGVLITISSDVAADGTNREGLVV
jgi:hypothetical protein